MNSEQRITINIFKTVTKAIAESDDLDIMTNHLSQLLVTALDIKACAIYVLDLETKELEMLASFGLSPKYVSKGPLLASKSISANLNGKAVIVPDVTKGNNIQYPDAVKDEGIAAIIAIPIMVSGGVLGALRLYHKEIWNISDQDLDSLHLLAEIIGLAMTYTSLMRAIYTINDVIHLGLPINIAPKINNP
ncbi:GAF domain-containing protein [Thermodesulfobacteriota bacterium]